MRRISIYLLLLFILTLAPSISAWEDCPFGLVNDPSPGRCGLYVDSNQDGLCDRSQKQPAIKADTPSVSSGKTPVTSSKPILQAKAQKPYGSYQNNKITSKQKSDIDTIGIATRFQSVDHSLPQPAVVPENNLPRHHAAIILLAVLVLSLMTEGAIAKRKTLAFVLQTFWNWALLLSFLGSALTGIYFLFPTLIIRWSAKAISYWHTETGLAFIAIGLYHAIRRFSCMIRGLKSCLK